MKLRQPRIPKKRQKAILRESSVSELKKAFQLRGPHWKKLIWEELKRRKNVRAAVLRDIFLLVPRNGRMRKEISDTLLSKPYELQNIWHIMTFYSPHAWKAWEKMLDHFAYQMLDPTAYCGIPYRDLLCALQQAPRQSALAGDIAEHLLFQGQRPEALLWIIRKASFRKAKKAWRYLEKQPHEVSTWELILALDHCPFPSIQESMWKRICAKHPPIRELRHLVNFSRKFKRRAGMEILRKPRVGMRRVAWVKRRIPSLANVPTSREYLSQLIP